MVCASPAYLEVHGTPLVPGDLAAHACGSFAAVSAADVWVFTQGRIVTQVPVKSRLVVNTAEAAVSAAIAGVGLTRVLAYQSAEAVEAGRLVTVLRGFEPKPVPVSLVTRSQPIQAQKVRAFLDFASVKLRQRLPA